MTNAWWGRFPLPLSFAVKATLSESVVPRATGFGRGDLAFNLRRKAVSTWLLRKGKSMPRWRTSPSHPQMPSSQ